MPASNHTPEPSEIHSPLTRRKLIRGGAMVAAAVLPAAPAFAMDARARAKYHAEQLRQAMNENDPGNWYAHLNYDSGFALIVSKEQRAEAEGPLLADDVTGTTEYADWEKRRQKGLGSRGRVSHG